MGCGCKLTGEELAKLLSEAIAAGGPEAQKLLSSLKGGIETATTSVEPEVAPPHLQNIPKDKIWGSILDTVNFIAETGKDLLEKLVAATSAAKALEQFLEAIPVVGEFLSTIPGTANWALGAAKAAYEAHDSITVRESLACNIFCIMKSNTDFTYNSFVDAMEQVLNKGYADIPSAITDISFILAGITPPQATWEVMMSAVGHILKFGGSVLGLDLPKLILSLNAGIADDDYLNCGCVADCDTTSEITYTTPGPDGLIIRDTTATEYSLYSTAPLPAQSAWSDLGDGVTRLGTDVVVNYNGANRAISVRTIQLPSAKKVCSVKVTYRLFGNTGPGELAIWTSNAGTRNFYDSVGTYDSAERTSTFYVEQTVDAIHLRTYKLYSGAKAGITKIEVFWDKNV